MHYRSLPYDLDQMLGICIKNESIHKLLEATNELLQKKWYNMMLPQEADLYFHSWVFRLIVNHLDLLKRAKKPSVSKVDTTA